MFDAQIDLLFDDLKHGRKTVDDLIAQKELYEGKNTMLTYAISEDTDTGEIGAALSVLYTSICIVLYCIADAFERKEAAAQLQGEA